MRLRIADMLALGTSSQEPCLACPACLVHLSQTCQWLGGLISVASFLLGLTWPSHFPSLPPAQRKFWQHLCQTKAKQQWEDEGSRDIPKAISLADLAELSLYALSGFLNFCLCSRRKFIYLSVLGMQGFSLADPWRRDFST